MPNRMQSAMLRRWAMECAARAEKPDTSLDQKERLLKMREALLDMADTQDWLEGRPPPQRHDVHDEHIPRQQ